MNGDAIHSELLRLLARRGELTELLEQNDLAIARYRGMFDVVQAVNAPVAPEPARAPEVDSSAPSASA